MQSGSNPVLFLVCQMFSSNSVCLKYLPQSWCCSTCRELGLLSPHRSELAIHSANYAMTNSQQTTIGPGATVDNIEQTRNQLVWLSVDTHLRCGIHHKVRAGGCRSPDLLEVHNHQSSISGSQIIVHSLQCCIPSHILYHNTTAVLGACCIPSHHSMP